MGAKAKDAIKESSALAKLRGVVRGESLRERHTRENGWNLDHLAGRMVELSGSGATAALTTTSRLIHEAQKRGEPVVWIAAWESIFFPPDFFQVGIDLDALPVLRLRDTRQAARAADTLLRSGGFTLVVIDLGANESIALPVQSRLAGLAKKHHSILVCLTRKDRSSPSLGSLVSVRGESEKRRTAFDRFACELRVLKDKKRGPGWRHVEVCRGPDGLC